MGAIVDIKIILNGEYSEICIVNFRDYVVYTFIFSRFSGRGLKLYSCNKYSCSGVCKSEEIV